MTYQEASDMMSQQDEHGAGDDVAAGPERGQAVRIIDGCGGLVFHSFLESKKAAPPAAAACNVIT